ncbi:MAG TPA: hypothetical protein VK472_04865 [Allosphingosinicella sp.]|nr:hypothetical protein [Allosphingosinicella sp.]
MKQKLTTHRRTACLLLAAAALPFTPAFAQDSTTTTQPPVVDVGPPPVATPAPQPVTPPQSTTPTVTTPPPTVVAPPPTVTTTRRVTTPAPTAERATPARRATRTTAQRTTTTRTSAPASAAPAPVAETVPAPDASAPIAAAPPETLPAPEVLPVETQAQPAEPPAARNIPWTLLGVVAVLLAGLVAFFAFRRRRVRDDVYDDYREEAVYEQPVPMAAAPEVASPLAFAAAGAPAVAAAETGEPHIEFEMRPRRAGVGEDDAKVEFALGVVNTGNATARDVRVSAWMLGDQSPGRSEAESALIDRVDIDAGEDANVEATVALPRSGLSEDAILPVVVTEARYRLPDGSEGRTTVSYAVGVPDGEEMMHFDVENPSGLHDGVVAREVDELERA